MTGLIAGWCAVCLALLAVRLLHRQDEAVRRARRLLAATGRPGGTRGTAARLPAGRARELLAAVRLSAERARRRLEARLGARIGPEVLCLPAGSVVALWARSPLPALCGLIAVPVVGRQLRDRAARTAGERRQESVAALSASVAGELRAGRPPETALTEAVQRLRESGGWGGALTPLLAAARFGGDVPGALRQAAGQPGAAGLAAAAACWEVALDGGAGLADGLDRVASALRAERAQRDDLRAQLAGPRATAVMLATLPAFGVLLGTALGADPLRVLFHRPVGLACLVAGALLEWIGLRWTARIVRAAEAGAP